MKLTVISIIIAGTIIGGVLILGKDNGGKNSVANVNNVTIVDGRQIIEIKAKGGYSPKISNAKAGIDTVIRVSTSSTFDCSSALVIPSINYRVNLPQTGTIEIPVTMQKTGTKLQGLCAMGMYSFSINFD